MRPTSDQDKPGESMGEMLAAAIRTSEPGTDQFKALIATIDRRLESSSTVTPGRMTIVGIVAALGLIAPTMQEMVGAVLGPGTQQLQAIESKLDDLTSAQRRNEAAMADLIRYVERLEAEQAHATQRPSVTMPARLRALVANDEIAAETD